MTFSSPVLAFGGPLVGPGLIDLVREIPALAGVGTDDALNPPADVSKLTAVAGDLTVSLEWVEPGDADFDGILVLREQGSEVTDSPTDASSYNVGDTIGTAEVVCKTAVAANGCSDSNVTNGVVYHYSAFSFDTSLNYAAAVPTIGHPRATSKLAWGVATGGSALAPAGAIPQQHVIGIGNDLYLHRMASADGSRGSWDLPQVGGSVQSRPMVGDMDTGAGTDLTAFVTAQDGLIYRFSLDNGTTTFEGSRDAVADAGCTSGILQAGPVVMFDAYDSNPNNDDDVVIVATRCGATDNKILLYNHDLTVLYDTYDGDAGGLGISNATPIMVYRDTSSNRVYVPVRADGGESLVAIEIESGPVFADTPFFTISGIGDIDASPTLVRRGTDRHVLLGNTIGELWVYNESGGFLDSFLTATGDGPVKGVSVSTGKKVGAIWENWVTWTTDTKIHFVKIGGPGRFTDSSYLTVDVSGPSLPLTLRWVGGTDNTRSYIGSSDGYLYEFNPENGAEVRRFLVETGKTVGDPSFDWADGTAQGIVVGTSSGAFHWVSLDWAGGE